MRKWLTEEELQKEERACESNRFDASEFCVWCLGHQCEDCFYTGFPERWFRMYEKAYAKLTRRQMARAAMVFNAWASGEGSDARRMAIAYGVPLWMIDGWSTKDLTVHWIRAYHQDVEPDSADECNLLASMLMGESELGT